jgi:hypothetical protein
VLVGEHDRLHPITQAQLREHARDMCLRRRLADHELGVEYWRPVVLPQRQILAVGIDDGELARLCAHWRVVAQIDNRWHIDNEERGRSIARCTLRAPLGELWASRIASNRL